MANREKTLISMAKKEEISTFVAALQQAKEDADGARAYAHLNPVCSRCEKSGRECHRMPDGIRCARCRDAKQACPRVIDFWITHIARCLRRPEAYVKDLYYRHGTNKRPGGAGGSSPSLGSGSGNSKSAVEPGQRVTKEGPEEGPEEEYSDFYEDEAIRRESHQIEVHDHAQVLAPQPKIKASGQSSTGGTNIRNEITRTDHKSAPESQRKEIELLKRRAEMAEGNFIALVGRVQDFRTSLRSELRTMPAAVESDGLSRLSTAIETAIDDAGLYLRNIPDPLKQSRSNWEIRCGTQSDKPKDGGSTGARALAGARQVRQRSPEVSDIQKRRKI